jgi:hypothetical protein
MTHGKAGATPNAYLTYVISLGDIAGQTLSRVIIDGEYTTFSGTAHADYGTPATGRRTDVELPFLVLLVAAGYDLTHTGLVAEQIAAAETALAATHTCPQKICQENTLQASPFSSLYLVRIASGKR